MIYITGDTHGEIDFDKLKRYFSKRYVSEKDYLIILGDAGIVWDKKSLEKSIFKYGCLGPTIFYIDGNHENFTMLEEYPVIHKNNAKVHVIAENIFHILRGELLILNNIKFLCVGGAESIDKHLRIEGISWWPEESVKEYDVDNALLNASICNCNVDYVLTHAAPSIIHNKELHFKDSASIKQLNRIEKYIHFKYWYFGHYHIDEKFYDKYRCFYNDIIEIPIMDCGKDNVSFHKLYGGSTYQPLKRYPYLYNWDSGKPTKVRREDLPEWYFENFNYYPAYYCLKDVVDVAYKGSPFDNHISKDSSIYLSYSKPIEKKKDYTPVDKDNLYSTWRCNVVSFTSGLEKYSPNLDLTKLKEKINLTYDQYNRNPLNHYRNVYVRPYPEIKTEVLKEVKYRVKEGKTILAEFFDLETAKIYTEKYITNNLDMKKFKEIQVSEDVVTYDTCDDTNNRVKIISLKDGIENEISS